MCETQPMKVDIVPSNKNIKVRSFKSSENIEKKEDGPDCTVSINKFSSSLSCVLYGASIIYLIIYTCIMKLSWLVG